MRRIPFPELYTLKDVAERSRLPRDVIQRWGNVGVLIAEEGSTHGGRGVHRRFQVSEMIIAILLRPFAKSDLPTGQLLRLAEVLRTSFRTQPGREQGIHYEEGLPQVGRALYRGAYGLGDAFLIVTLHETVKWVGAFTGEGDEPFVWEMGNFFRTAVPRPEAVVVIDLAILRGVLGDPPTKQ
jgi:hypothetical protein